MSGAFIQFEIRWSLTFSLRERITVLLPLYCNNLRKWIPEPGKSGTLRGNADAEITHDNVTRNFFP
jgi:hypothetical protein